MTSENTTIFVYILSYWPDTSMQSLNFDATLKAGHSQIDHPHKVDMSDTEAHTLIEIHPVHGQIYFHDQNTCSKSVPKKYWIHWKVHDFKKSTMAAAIFVTLQVFCQGKAV